MTTVDRAQSRGVLLAIAAGGALGAPARYGVAQIVHVSQDGYPWATFWTNLSGSLALGFLLVLIASTSRTRALVATGFLGAYTTFSTFEVESVLLVKDGHTPTALLYVAASVLGGLGLAWLGIAAGRHVTKRNSP